MIPPGGLALLLQFSLERGRGSRARAPRPASAGHDATRNSPNQVYTLADPPAWLPESDHDFAYQLEIALEIIGREWAGAPEPADA
jgi:hypothetical protein